MKPRLTGYCPELFIPQFADFPCHYTYTNHWTVNIYWKQLSKYCLGKRFNTQMKNSSHLGAIQWLLWAIKIYVVIPWHCFEWLLSLKCANRPAQSQMSLQCSLLPLPFCCKSDFSWKGLLQRKKQTTILVSLHLSSRSQVSLVKGNGSDTTCAAAFNYKPYRL